MDAFGVVVDFFDDGDVADLDAVVDVLVTDFFFIVADVIHRLFDHASGDLAFDRGCWCSGLSQFLNSKKANHLI